MIFAEDCPDDERRKDPRRDQACANDLRKGCATLALYEFLYCRDGAGWACNELGSHYVEGVIVDPDPEVSGALFAQACQLGFQTGCLNTSNTASPVMPRSK